MSRINYKKKKDIILLVLMLLMVTVAYATLTTSLAINGTTKIKSATWNIVWDNSKVSEGSIISTKPTIDQLTTTATYNVELEKPGDFYEFTIDVKNNGSIDAMIENISNKTYESDGITAKDTPIYITYQLKYSDGSALEKKHLLAAGQTETYKVRVEFTKDIDSTQLPKNEDTIIFKFEVNYIQADENAIVRS